MKEFNFDVLILGSGIAGLTSAIKLAESGLKIAIVTREDSSTETNTYWAQGGIIYPQEASIEMETLVQDIDKASSYTSNLKAAEILATRSANILEEILIEKTGANFAKDSDGNLSLTKEAAHSIKRIIYKGDMTGREIQKSLYNYISDKSYFPNVTFLKNFTAIDLITPNHHGVQIHQRYEDHKVVGAYLYDQINDKVVKAMSKFTILATGGIGALYLHHSNADGSRGDGHAMAKRAGAYISNMEFVQFHPTTFYDRSSHRRFLISEALRGEGGRLINSKGETFMNFYHKDGELAPRDVVSRAIIDQMLKYKDDCVYLDISHKDPEWLKERFPTIYEHCLERRIDMTKEPIPVVPAAHYSCGGVKVNLKGETNVECLYAVGEVACNGLHGANRLASTSLLEGLTFGYIAAENIIEEVNGMTCYDSTLVRDWRMGEEEIDLALTSQDWMTLKQTMWNYVGVTRSKNRLLRAKAMFIEMNDEIGKFYKNSKLHDELIGLRNGVEVAFMVLNASLRNKKSAGCFHLDQK
jgi:L-aspartate oxidase